MRLHARAPPAAPGSAATRLALAAIRMPVGHVPATDRHSRRRGLGAYARVRTANFFTAAYQAIDEIVDRVVEAERAVPGQDRADEARALARPALIPDNVKRHAAPLEVAHRRIVAAISSRQLARAPDRPPGA
jgi:hypothetical protein